MGFLSQMVEETRKVISQPAYLAGLPVSSRPPARRGLRQAILEAGGPGALLVEFKRVSPGSTAPALPAFSADEFVRRAEPGGVSGYSCLASTPRFEGSLTDVREVANATSRPVLFKDFVLDPVQLDAAARVGASAVLLIARLETEGYLATPLTELARGAHARGLEVLLEYHERSELSRTADVAADMHGVNVRDLDTLRMDPEIAISTLGAARERRPLLGLSGVASPGDARRFWDAGVDGILVGSAVARASDPGAFLRSLHRRPAGSGA